MMRTLLMLLGCALLASCASKPPVPQWQQRAAQAVEQATLATLQGNDRLAQHHWSLALEQTRLTASAAPMARVELIRCAVIQASTLQSSCPGFEALREQATAADQAYARYLTGQLRAADVALLPPAHIPVARALVAGGDAPAQAQALASMTDPLARLLAASVWAQQAPAWPVVLTAVETASAQGWRRPLITWLTLQERLAKEAGQNDVAAQAQQRLRWLTEAATKPPRPN